MTNEHRKPSIYFAHPYDTIGTEDEKEIMDILGTLYKVVNPFDHEVKLEEKYGEQYYQITGRILNGNAKTEDVDKLQKYARDIVTEDYQLLNSCDGYIGWVPRTIKMWEGRYYNTKTVWITGTIVELTWAMKLQKSPIWILLQEDASRINPFYLQLSDLVIVGIKKLKDVLGSDLKKGIVV